MTNTVGTDFEQILTQMASPEGGRQSLACALGEVLSSIAHELNQPLTAAAAFAEAADLRLEQQGRDKTDPVRREVRCCLDEIHHTAEIIRNLREFVREGAPDQKPHDVNDAVNEALLMLLPGPAPRSLQTHIRLAPDLPPVNMDRMQFQHAMVNLIRNALEVMAGCSRQRLEVSTDFDGQHVEIRVADNGPGINPALKGHLFEPFVTGKKGGLGLGLAISRTIVEGLGGKLTAGPNWPEGTFFTVRLPVDQAGRRS
jgi:two-component system, LuxR family, sensor kinase FixL